MKRLAPLVDTDIFMSRKSCLKMREMMAAKVQVEAGIDGVIYSKFDANCSLCNALLCFSVCIIL